jgi:hypothetical protein
VSPEELSLGEAISVVLLVEQTEDHVGAFLAGLLDIFLDGEGLTMKMALGMRFSSSSLCSSDSPLIGKLIIFISNQIYAFLRESMNIIISELFVEVPL